MKERNEYTSPRVLKMAARLLRKQATGPLLVGMWPNHVEALRVLMGYEVNVYCKTAEAKEGFGSLLTQARDRKKAATKASK